MQVWKCFCVFQQLKVRRGKETKTGRLLICSQSNSLFLTYHSHPLKKKKSETMCQFFSEFGIISVILSTILFFSLFPELRRHVSVPLFRIIFLLSCIISPFTHIYSSSSKNIFALLLVFFYHPSFKKNIQGRIYFCSSSQCF